MGRNKVKRKERLATALRGHLGCSKEEALERADLIIRLEEVNETKK